MLNYINLRIKSDKGAANTIEMIIIVLILFSIMVTIVDTGLYFNNRYIITSAAQNGARLAAVYGGAGNTKIAQKYGVSTITSACASHGANSVVACSVFQELMQNTSAVNTEITSISCGPDETTLIGERTWCEIHYRYKGTPGSGLAMANIFKENTVKISAETEVIHSK